jgi:hypothetical protein
MENIAPNSLQVDQPQNTSTKSTTSIRMPSELVLSPVFDTYWKFAVERQKIFFARANASPMPWTTDAILDEYKFTNAYRASDRVSQFLIKTVIYNGEKDINEVFFRTILFKLFNKIETWELLESQLGEVSLKSYDYQKYETILSLAMQSGAAIYSAAYIMASGHKLFGVEKKHQAHLRLIEKMIEDSVPERLRNCLSMSEGFELLKSYPLVGDFLAYQLITDINYSEITNFDEMEFTTPGPGAKDGIRKCFKSIGRYTEADIIRFMADRQEYEFDRLGLQFQRLGQRRLQLIDIQNLFCEVDKYSRIKHPEIAGISGRTRIKQKFKGSKGAIDYFYPPKWNVQI